MNKVKYFLSTGMISLFLAFSALALAKQAQQVDFTSLYPKQLSSHTSTVAPCSMPKPWLTQKTFHYKDFLNVDKTFSLNVSDATAQTIQDTLNEVINGGLRFAQIETYSFDMNILDKLNHNVSLIAECYVPFDGQTEIIFIANPVQNPLIYSDTRCHTSTADCELKILPATGLLSVNRSHNFIGKVDNFVPIFQARGWKYRHQPMPNILSWGIFTLAIS